MFCSSLRQRKDWGAVFPALPREADQGWKEQYLDHYDVGIPFCPESKRCLKLLILTAEEADSPQTKDRLQNLSGLDAGKDVAVIVTLNGQEGMLALVKLQIELLQYGGIPVIPIFSVSDLPACLSALRSSLSEVGKTSTNNATLQGESQSIASYCVLGEPLSRDQTKVLTELTPRLRDLAIGINDPNNQLVLTRKLGACDGERVVGFFIDGHPKFSE